MEIIQLERIQFTLAVHKSIHMRVGVHQQTVSTIDKHLWLISLTSLLAWLHSVMKPGVVTSALARVQSLSCPVAVTKLEKLNIRIFI